MIDRFREEMPAHLHEGLPEDAVRERRKTVTRRLGWKFLKVGDTLTLCRKVMGRKPDEPLVRIAEVRVVDVRREALWDIADEDVEREGFADWDRHMFVGFFCSAMNCDPSTEITRVEWEYLPAKGEAA